MQLGAGVRLKKCDPSKIYLVFLKIYNLILTRFMEIGQGVVLWGFMLELVLLSINFCIKTLHISPVF